MVTFKKQKGFSLIEIIVAFSIAVMSLAVLYNIQSNAVRSSILYDEYLIANRIGASLLAEASVQRQQRALMIINIFGKLAPLITFQIPRLVNRLITLRSVMSP